MNKNKELSPALEKTLEMLKNRYPDDQDIQQLKREISLYCTRGPGLTEAEESLERYQDLVLNNLPDMDIYLIDRDLRILFMAGLEKEKYSFDSESFVGKTINEILTSQNRRKLLALYKSIFQGKSRFEQIQYGNQSYDITTRPLYNGQNEIMAGLIVIHNITRVKKVETKLKKAREKAEIAEKANSLFLATMSHEIRTPLNTIIGFSSQLGKSSLDETQTKYLHNIQRSSEHLLHVVNDLLMLFKIGFGKVFIDQVPFSVRSVLKEIAQLFENEAVKKGLEIELRISRKVDKIIIGDPFRLKQILINIIGNGIKFTEKGKVCIRCMVDSFGKNDEMLIIEVKDTGIGIPAKDMNKVFDEFTQAENILQKRRDGTGLGLTISKKLIELMNGNIEVKSKLNKGTTFTITIPYKKAETDHNLVHSGKYNLLEKQLSGKKILLADDDEYNLMLSEAIFKDWGMVYDFASNGLEALQKSEAEKYDILMFDIHMPGMNGQTLVRKIRQDSKNPNTEGNVLTMTANILKSDLKSYLVDGFNDFILKPYKEEELYNKLCAVLNIPVQKKRRKPMKKVTTKNSGSLIDLGELRNTAKGDEEFERKMIRSFIKNSTSYIREMKQSMETGNFVNVGELAHKMLGSFRFFKIETIVRNLEDIEEKCLRTGNHREAASIAKTTIISIEELLSALKEEYK